MAKNLIDDTVLDNERCRCHCKTVKLKREVAIGSCVNDNVAVATLPNEWTPKHGGTILANHLKKLEENHNKALEKLNADTCSINQDIDKNVGELAQELVDHIKHNQSQIDKAVAACDISEGPLKPENRSVVLKEITDLYNSRLEEIATFRQNALKLENERLDRLKIMMRDNFQNVIKVGHYPPQVLIQDFNNRMYDFNQQLFNNLRAYEELEEELKADANENVMRARSALNQLCVGIGLGVVYRSGSARRPSEKRIYIKRSVSCERKEEYTPMTTIGTAQEEIEKYVTKLVEAYRQGVLKVLNGFYDQLRDLNKNLIYGDNYKDESKPTLSDLDTVIESAFKSIANTIQEQTSSALAAALLQVTKTDVINIQRSLNSLRECLRDTYVVLHAAGHLWDAHMMRTALAQKLTIAAVEDLQTNNDIVEQSNEVAFNLALEQFLVNPDEDKLTAQMAVLMSLLDRTSDLYQQHYNDELNRLKQFMNLPPVMANVLLAEFQCFLSNNKKDPLVSATNIEGLPIITNYDPSNDRSLIPRAILQTELQEKSLKNWRSGFLEALENSVHQIPGELLHQAELWVEDRSSALRSRLTMKQTAHSIRAERIKSAYEKRLAELRYQKNRLKSHQNAVDELIAKLSSNISNYLDLDAPEIYPLRTWAQSIENNMQMMQNDPEFNVDLQTMKMRSYKLRLAKHRILFEESVNEAIREFEVELENRLQTVRIANVRYMKSMELFNEGGIYSVAEATRVTAVLTKISDVVNSWETKLPDVLNTRRTQLLAMADAELHPLNKIIDDFNKMDKKRSDMEKAGPKDMKKKNK